MNQLTCDLCGGERQTKGFAFSEVAVRCEVGYAFPGGSSITETRVELCAACFLDKLIPWLQTQGVVAHVEQKDWL